MPRLNHTAGLQRAIQASRRRIAYAPLPQEKKLQNTRELSYAELRSCTNQTWSQSQVQKTQKKSQE